MECLQAYFHAWNAHDADAILATFADGGTYQDPTTGGPISGAAFKGWAGALWAAFPDLRFEKQSLGEMGPDLFAGQWRMIGTNLGSFNGLPPTGAEVSTDGADFFVMEGGKIKSVTGYFDPGSVPRQLDLDIVVQPKQIGPFAFGTSTQVQTGKLDEPGAFSITTLHARDDAAAEAVREGSRESLIEMLGMEGFIGATTAKIGSRMVTISAWSDADAPRQVMRQGTHAEEQKKFYDGSYADSGFTSVWTLERMNGVMDRCDACGKMTRDPGPDRACGSCGETLPDARPYW